MRRWMAAVRRGLHKGPRARGGGQATGTDWSRHRQGPGAAKPVGGARAAAACARARYRARRQRSRLGAAPRGGAPLAPWAGGSDKLGAGVVVHVVKTADLKWFASVRGFVNFSRHVPPGVRKTGERLWLRYPVGDGDGPGMARAPHSGAEPPSTAAAGAQRQAA